MPRGCPSCAQRSPTSPKDARPAREGRAPSTNECLCASCARDPTRSQSEGVYARARVRASVRVRALAIAWGAMPCECTTAAVSVRRTCATTVGPPARPPARPQALAPSLSLSHSPTRSFCRRKQTHAQTHTRTQTHAQIRKRTHTRTRTQTHAHIRKRAHTTASTHCGTTGRAVALPAVPRRRCGHAIRESTGSV